MNGSIMEEYPIIDVVFHPFFQKEYNIYLFEGVLRPYVSDLPFKNEQVGGPKHLIQKIGHGGRIHYNWSDNNEFWAWA